ncbi:hypothetical protein EYR36_011986 [Pleurotus pulmonarius]|nr:hypothetical protein EYR36_011986 [Pleurotus pulmonarius]
MPRSRISSISADNPADANGGVDNFLSEAQMPYLRTLDVRCFELPHTISVLPQLRSLRYMPLIGTPRTTVAAMLSFLRSTPSLEHLEILGTLRPSDNGGKELATVELTKLSFLSYTTPDYGDISLCRFLHYPPSLRVKFSSLMPSSDTDAYANDLASILTRVASSDAAAAIDEVSFAAMDGDYFDMQVLGHDGAVLEIHLPVMEGQLPPLLKLPTMLPYSGARTLLIHGFHSVTVADWANIFTRHSQVQHLTVEDVDSNFFRALLKPTENESPPFTHLKSLLLSQCDIGEHMALVKRILEEHRQLDADIGVTIKIERCRVAQDSIRELEACAKVVWDGIEEFVVDSDEEYEYGDETDHNTEEEEDDEEDDDDDELVFISTA